MVDTTSIITLAAGLIAVMAVFIGIRITHFGHNIQDLGGDVTKWSDDIYEKEYKPEFEKEKVDPYKIMNVAAKYFSVKNLHSTLDMFEFENTYGIRSELFFMGVMGMAVGLSVVSDSFHLSVVNIIPEFFLSYILPTVIMLVAFGIGLNRWYHFWINYNEVRKRIKGKDDEFL